MEQFYLEESEHDGHRDRLRNRLITKGMHALKPHEVLEFLLYSVVPRQDVSELAKNLIDAFGSVGAVLYANLDELRQVEGMGHRTAFWLATIGETMRNYRFLEETDALPARCMRDVLRYAYSLLDIVRPPSSMQLCTDGLGMLIYSREITPSRAWGEPETLKEAIADVLCTGAKGVTILQFTDDRFCDPDDYDRKRAEAYSYTLRAAGCALLDVMLINQYRAVSMRQLGMVPDPPLESVSRQLREEYDRHMFDLPSGDLDLAGLLLTEQADPEEF